MTSASLSNLFEAIHANPWADQLVDLQSLNAAASGAVEKCVQELRETARTQPTELRSRSIVVLGPPGAGKTHLFARLRRRMGPRAVFIHVRPLVSSELTPRILLYEMVNQLGYATLGVRQIEALVGSLLAHHAGVGSQFPRAQLEDYTRLNIEERAERLEHVLDTVMSIWPDLHESWLRRLLSAPFAPPPTQRALLAWLGGAECDSMQLQRIGATAALGEEAIIPALRTLAAVASLGAPLVIVFDQLENLIDGSAPGPRLLGYANLAAELVDSVRGLTLVHLALDTEWLRGIEPALNLSQRSRVLMQRETLTLPTPAEREELLRLWVDRLPQLEQPFPWPFGERRVQRWLATVGMTPRMLMIECRAALESGVDADELDTEPNTSAPDGHEPLATTESLHAALMQQWVEHLNEARCTLDENAQANRCVHAARWTDGVLAMLQFVPEVRIERARVNELIQLELHTELGPLHVALLHQPRHNGIGAALAKLATLAQRTSVLALRERSFDLLPSWKDTLNKRATFLAQPRARFMLVDREDMARLLALAAFLQAARSRDVLDASGRPATGEVVTAFVAQQLDVPNWGLAQALSGEPPQVVADEQLLSEFPPDPAGAASDTPAVSSVCDVTLTILARLRLSSLDRLVREVTRVDSKVTRASVLAALDASGNRVRWFGRTIVTLQGDS